MTGIRSGARNQAGAASAAPGRLREPARRPHIDSDPGAAPHLVPDPASAAAAGDLAGVPAVVLLAMRWSAEFGVDTVSPAAGATLRLLAGTARAGAVVEIGTGLGVSGLWLLEGMRADGVLTTIDIDPDHQAMARQAFAAAGHPPARTRLIRGGARTVLPRLADGAYDLVFVDVVMGDYRECVNAAHRVLRDSGLLVVHGALPAALLRDAPEWTPALLPAGDGLLCAVKRPSTLRGRMD